MSEPQFPSVFISYSHDSDDHRNRVLNLSTRLRETGFETILDRYVESGSPQEGWPRWMLNGLDRATFVLCVCTATYYRRFRGIEVPGKGKGVDWEGALISQALYDARSVSNKFVPVVFAAPDPLHLNVPEPLRGQTIYVLDSGDGFDKLVARLRGESGIKPPPVTAFRKVLSAQSADRQDQLNLHLVEEAIAVDTETRLRVRQLIDELLAKRTRIDPEWGLLMLDGAFGILAAWTLVMSLTVPFLLCLAVCLILMMLVLALRRKRIPQAGERILRALGIENIWMPRLAAMLLLAVLIMVFCATFVQIESLPARVDAVGVQNSSGEELLRMPRSTRRLLFIPPWGRGVKVVADDWVTLRPVATPWRPMQITESMFVPWIRIEVECPLELQVALPGNPGEPKARIRITAADKELFSGEYLGEPFVITNDAGRPESIQCIVAEMLRSGESLKLEIRNAADGLMVELEIPVQNGHAKRVLPAP